MPLLANYYSCTAVFQFYSSLPKVGEKWETTSSTSFLLLPNKTDGFTLKDGEKLMPGIPVIIAPLLMD